MVIRCTIISRISRVGDVGEPGYSVSGEEVPACRKSGSHDSWHGATQGNLRDVMPTSYITRSVYNYLTESERNEIRSRVKGVCENGCVHRIDNPYYGGGQCWALNESKIIKDFPYPHDPCDVVVCEDECVGVDRYAMVCKDGVCVRGEIVEANSAKCGYVTPECAEGDKKPGYICSEGKWVPYTPVKQQLYVKFDVPWLDLLPGIPYEPWMIIPPGFKVVEEP